MNKLKLIRITIDTFGILIIVGISIVIVVFVTLPEGVYVSIGEPHWKITSDPLVKDISKQFIDQLKNNQGESRLGIVLETENIQMSLPVRLELRILIIAIALIASGYMTFLLIIMKRIIADVRNNAPFNSKNIKRLKIIGILITIAPLIEWLLQAGFSIWINRQYQFDELKLVNNTILGLPVLFLGLLVIVLGVAFEQGQKIQEENELTV